MNVYARLPQLRRAINLTSAMDGEDDRLLDIAEQMSRAIDDYLGYPAYLRRGWAASAYTDALREWAAFDVPIVDAATVEVDRGDGYVPLSASDYRLEPVDAPGVARPYWRVAAVRGGSAYPLPASRGAVRVTGWLGLVPSRLTLQATVTCTASQTTVTIPGASRGDVIGLDDELVLVTSVTGSTATVVRGHNGTTPSAHADVTPEVVLPPLPVTRALLAWVGRIAWDESGGWQGSVVLTDVGGGAYPGRSTTAWAAIRSLLSPYRRVPVA